MKYYTSEEAAEELGKSIHTIRQWLFYEKIKAYKDGASYKIPEYEITRIKNEKQLP